MSPPEEIQGRCDPAFAAVLEALRENLANRGDVGAAVAVEVEGRCVVDLWGGWADAPARRPWRSDTVVNVFSVGKAMAALCALRLADHGALDLDAPVTRYWPQLRTGEAPVRVLLSHGAGLAAIERPLPDGALYDWPAIIAALEDQAPWWPPGSAHGYHVHTFGFLVGELVRRVAGESIGSVLAREVTGPLGAEVWWGLPRSERNRRATFAYGAEMLARAADPEMSEEPLTPGVVRLRACVYPNPPGATGVGTVNTEPWLDAELPSVNAHASARGVARIYGALLEGALLSDAMLAEATREAASGEDLVLGRPSRFGLGFQLTQPERPLGPNPRSFGHFGAGGALGFADPDARVAFAYVMNHGGHRWRNPRNRALVDALYGALG